MYILYNKISVFTYNNYLFLAGDFGIIYTQISNFVNLLCLSINRYYLDISMIKNSYKNLVLKSTCFFKIKTMFDNLLKTHRNKLLLFGIGFRCWRLQNVIIFKLGFSKDISVMLPGYIKIVCLKPLFFLLKSCDKIKLDKFLISLRRLRIPDIYKGKGILHVNEKICLKQGKRN